MLGQADMRVAGGEKATFDGQDCALFLEVCQIFRTVGMQREDERISKIK